MKRLAIVALLAAGCFDFDRIVGNELDLGVADLTGADLFGLDLRNAGQGDLAGADLSGVCGGLQSPTGWKLVVGKSGSINAVLANTDGMYALTNESRLYTVIGGSSPQTAANPPAGPMNTPLSSMASLASNSLVVAGYDTTTDNTQLYDASLVTHSPLEPTNNDGRHPTAVAVDFLHLYLGFETDLSGGPSSVIDVYHRTLNNLGAEDAQQPVGGAVRALHDARNGMLACVLDMTYGLWAHDVSSWKQFAPPLPGIGCLGLDVVGTNGGGERIVAISRDTPVSKVCVLDDPAMPWKCMPVFPPGETPQALAINPCQPDEILVVGDMGHVAVSNNGGAMWKMDTSFAAGISALKSVAFTPDGNSVIVGGVNTLMVRY